MPRPYERKRDFNYVVSPLLSPVGARHASPLQTKKRFQLRRVSAPLSCRGEACLAPTNESEISITPCVRSSCRGEACLAPTNEREISITPCGRSSLLLRRGMPRPYKRQRVFNYAGVCAQFQYQSRVGGNP